LLYAGRLNQEKDAKLVLDSLPRLLSDPRVHVTVIGRGPLAPYFAMFQHPRYRFPGFVEDRDEVRRIFDAHDILLAPTHETFGLAAIEGMARGLVLIAPDHGNTAYLLRQAGSPFLFAAGDIDDFQDKVRDAVDSDRRLHSLRAREIAERYGSFRAAIERLTAFYIAMLEERGIKNS
jgi:glycosyltransferase involved in cell wall biosynthesis